MSDHPVETFKQSARWQRFLEAVHLQDMEGNPLMPEEIAMFEMFERENWSGDQCREYIKEKLTKR